MRKPSGVPDSHQGARRSVIGAIASRWWQILLLWLVLFVPVAYVIDATNPPRYEAVSRIRIEPIQPTLFEQMGTSFADPRTYEPYLQTQINLMMSNHVLNRAIARPSAANLPTITRSEDPKTDIREKMVVKIEPDTYFIQMKVEQKTTNDDSFQFAYAQQELTSLLGRAEQVKRNLAQLEFQSRHEQYRVALVDNAEVPKIPVNNKRLRYLAAAPIVILFLLLAGFLVSEIGARRGTRAAVAPPVAPATPPVSRAPASDADKMVGLAYACRRSQEVQRSGGKVALVEGRFDKIDYGVVHLLQFARNHGDFLIVGVESDASVERSGEPGQPTMPQDQRAYLLSLYSFVDLVVAFDRRIPLTLIQAIRPDVLVTSGDAAPEAVAAAEFVRSYGGRMAICPRVTAT